MRFLFGFFIFCSIASVQGADTLTNPLSEEEEICALKENMRQELPVLKENVERLTKMISMAWTSIHLIERALDDSDPSCVGQVSTLLHELRVLSKDISVKCDDNSK